MHPHTHNIGVRTAETEVSVYTREHLAVGTPPRTQYTNACIGHTQLRMHAHLYRYICPSGWLPQGKKSPTCLLRKQVSATSAKKTKDFTHPQVGDDCGSPETHLSPL